MPADRAADRTARGVVHQSRVHGGRGPFLVWSDIEIRNVPSGQSAVAVRGAIKDLVEQLGVGKVLVSIAHCRTHATAYAIAVSGKPDN